MRRADSVQGWGRRGDWTHPGEILAVLKRSGQSWRAEAGRGRIFMWSHLTVLAAWCPEPWPVSSVTSTASVSFSLSKAVGQNDGPP